MTAPTSPKPHTPADLTVSKDAATTLDNEAADAGLRTDLPPHIHIGPLDDDGSCRHCDWCTGCGAPSTWTPEETCTACGYVWGGERD